MPATAILTGASGYVGRVLAAALIARENVELILPLRAGHDLDAIGRAIVEEAVRLEPRRSVEDYAARFRFVPIDDITGSLTGEEKRSVRELIHAAGCVDYFNIEKLNAGNVRLTEQMLDVARQHGLERFIFVSTAFSCGRTDLNPIPEQLHEDTGREELTEYIRSKRRAEWLVANSGLPYLIVRPPVLIGDSADGRYSGKAYGLVQFWEGWSRLILAKYRREMHFVARTGTLTPLLHQDDLQASFLAARSGLAPDAIIHLVAAQENLVPTREIYEIAVRRARPQVVHFYQRYEDVPRERLESSARAFLDFCAVNIEISEGVWPFERANMRRLEAAGLAPPRVTSASVSRCFESFGAQSKHMARYFARHGSELAETVEIIDHPSRRAEA